MLEKKCQNKMSKEASSNMSNDEQETTMPTAASSRTLRPTDQNTNGKLTIVKMINSEIEIDIQNAEVSFQLSDNFVGQMHQATHGQCRWEKLNTKSKTATV